MATFDAESKWLACLHACLVVVANDIIFLINLYEHFCIQSVLIFMLMNFKRMVKGQCPIMKALHAMDIHVHTHTHTDGTPGRINGEFVSDLRYSTFRVADLILQGRMVRNHGLYTR